VKYDLAVAYLNAGHPDKALQLLQPLAAEQPENASVLSSLGSAYEATDQLPQALEAYKSAVRDDPQNPDRYLDYTRLLMDLDRNDEAMNVVEQAIPTAQDAYALDIRLGVLCIKQGRFDEARTALNQAIQLHPEIVVGYVALAQSYMQQGSNDKALEPLLKARGTLPSDAALEYYVGLVSLCLGHYTDAEAALKNSARLRPEVVESHYQLGKLYFETNRLHDAQSEFERVIALAPGNSNAHYQLSKIYARLGDTQKAAEMATETKRLMQTQRKNALRLQKDRLSEFQPPTDK
jgi:tetratricopeptide (TPR) repeat protein